MLTEKDYCDYATCVALKELGLLFEDASQRFERNILTYRYEEVPRPLLYEAQKWLREENELHLEIDRIGYEWQVSIVEMKKNVCLAVKNRCESYEEALLEGVRASIKLLKEEK